MSYIGNSPGNASQRVVTRKVATAGQTRFASDSGYATGYVDVIVNGSDLVAGVDFNETGDGINIDLVEACAADDNVKIVAYIPRGLSDGYTKPEANTLLALKADLVAGKIPSSQLPAYVDDVLEYANLAAFPATGSAGIIYVAQDTNNCYRWSGSAYIVLTDLSAYYTKTQSDAKYVGKDSSTGAATMPVGTTAQRPTTPATGMFRMNSTTGQPEWYSSTTNSWISFADSPFYTADVLVVAGGGSGGYGGSNYGGGGGAGGLIWKSGAILNAGQQFSIIIGAGGAQQPSVTAGNSGSDTTALSLTAKGGGGGGAQDYALGQPGGSGGGGGYPSGSAGSAGTNYGSATQTSQLGDSGVYGFGNNGGGGNTSPNGGGGGGGAGASGQYGSPCNGGVGKDISSQLGTSFGSSGWFAGGGGGSNQAGYPTPAGGAGGGGSGSVYNQTSSTAGLTNTGGGGGAGTNAKPAGQAGGSGFVAIRYVGAQRGLGGVISSYNGYTIHTFTSSGTFTA